MPNPRQPNVRGRASQSGATTGNNTLRHPGPYVARVVSHLDKKFGGGLEVELLKSASAGNITDADSQIVSVKYASPFYGVTPLENNDTNDRYSSTQQSYGFWAVPPDVGTKVLVIFVEGDISQGYWIACVQDDYMNFMVPEPRVSTTITTPGIPAGLAGKKVPVAEYNKFIANPNNNYPTSQPKPYNETYVDRMLDQGLIDDDVRGTTSTSARREVPSNVYGISTPGPLDKREGAPKKQRGPSDSKATVYSSRLGGHSIVMDDGDETILRTGSAAEFPKEYIRPTTGSSTTGDVELPANELFRIRTRTGHQILLHNTEDLIYISNSRGTTWIELTSNGKIDIFAQDSISIHSQQDLNVTADRDINFSAFENINMSAGKELKINSGDSMSITTGNFFAVNSGESVSLKANTFFSGYGNTSASLIGSTGNVTLSSGASTSISSKSNVDIISNSSVVVSSNGELHLQSDGSAYLASVGGSLYVKAGGNVQQEATGSMHLKAGASLSQQAAGGSVNIKASASINNQAGAGVNLKGPKVALDGDTVYINSGKSADAAGAFSSTTAKVPSDANPQTPVPAKPALLPSRVPQHEPWLQHENLNPTKYTPEYTRAGNQSIDSFAPPIPDTFVPNSGSTNGMTQSAQGYPAGGMPNGYNDSNAETGDALQPYDETNLGTPNAKRAFEFFKSKGLTAAQSAGIVGNLIAESNVQPNGPNGDSGNAHGIAQWNKQRSPDRVANFLKVTGVPLEGSNLDQQLEFIWWELQSSYYRKRVYEPIVALVDPPDNDFNKLRKIAEDAATIFDEKYEVSDPASLGKRRRLADSFYVQSTNNFDPNINPGIVNGSTTASDGSNNSSSGPNIPMGPANLIDPGSGNLAMRVVENQGSSTRCLPIQEGLKNVLNRAAHAAGIDQVVVYSGGQPTYPNGPRTGSTRHDLGHAADVYLVVGGRKLVNTTDRSLMESYLTAVVKYGARGLGHSDPYMGPSNIHIDCIGAAGSNPPSLLVWGDGGHYNTRLEWVEVACKRGLIA